MKKMKTNDLALPRTNELDRNSYTVSLLRLASKRGLLTERRFDELRRQFRTEFAEVAGQYTYRRSTSLSRKNAWKLYRSLVYRCDAGLLTLNDDERAMRALLHLPLRLILDAGNEAVLRCFDECKTAYDNACAVRLPVRIEEYVYAMDTAFDRFKNNYSARFDALNICTEINYPLLNTCKTKGVFYIKEYYTSLGYENTFCSAFSLDEIIRLLLAYGKMYNCLYVDLWFNFCGVVLRNHLAARLLDKPFNTLLLERSDISDLYSKCACLTLDTLTMAFTEYLAKGVCSEDTAILQYLSSYAAEFAKELIKHIERGTVDKYIVTE